MTFTDHDPHIPDDLAASLHRAATRVPAADLHPSTPVLRLRARRRRRRAFAASGVAAALVATGVMVSQLGGNDGDVIIEPSDVAIGPAQPGTVTNTVLLPWAWAELQPDGTIGELPKAQPDDSTREAVRLADGRLVTLVARGGDRRAEELGVDPSGDPGSQQMMLGVFSPTGELVGEQDVSQDGVHTSLVGERDGQIVLSRSAVDESGTPAAGVTLSAVDPTGFEETPLASHDDVVFGTAAIGGNTVAAASNAVEDEPAGTCTVWVSDVSTSNANTIPVDDCLSIYDVAVSPGGNYAALQMDSTMPGQDFDGPFRSRLVVVDIVTGELVADQRVDRPELCEGMDPDVCPMLEPRGLAWTADNTVTVVVEDPAPGPNEGHIDDSEAIVPERLRSVTVDVPA